MLRTAYQLQTNITTASVQKAIGYSIERTSIHRALQLFCKKGLLLAVANTYGLIEYMVNNEQQKAHTRKATFICRQCQGTTDLVITEMLLNEQQQISVEKILFEGVCACCRK